MVRGGICHTFYTSKILKFSNFTQEERIHRNIFGKKIELSIHIRTNFNYFVKTCSLNSLNYTKMIMFRFNF